MFGGENLNVGEPNYLWLADYEPTTESIKKKKKTIL